MDIVGVSPALVRLAGANAALVYGQLDYWTNKANGGVNRFSVHKSDGQWVAKSRADLAEETGLTAKQVRTAIETLKGKGLIKVSQKLFNGVAVSHFSIAQMGQPEPESMAQTGQPAIAQMGHPIYIETVLETNKIIGDGVADGGCATQISSGELEMVSGKKSYSVSDMLEGHSAVKKTEKVTPENSKKPGQLASVFRTTHMEAFPDLFVPAFTTKDLGQFGHFATRCKPHNAGLIIDHCVREWGSFKNRAVQDEAAINPPDLPSISFLLRFVKSAVNLYLDDTAPQKPSKPKIAFKPIQPPPQPEKALTKAPVDHTDPSDPDNYIPTDPDEVYKLLGLGKN